MDISEDFPEDRYDGARRELIRRHERHPERCSSRPRDAT